MKYPKAPFVRIGAAAALVAALACLAAFPPVFRSLVAALLDVTTGYRVAFGSLDLHLDRAVAGDVRVWRAGEAVFAARAATADFRLRDLLPGGEHRYGLVSFALRGPQLTLVRRADGSFGPLLGGGGSAGPASGGQAPLAFTGTIAGGSVVLIDAKRLEPASRHLEVDALAGTVTSNADGVRYKLTGDFAADSAQAFELQGRIDAAGYAVHRLRARAIALPALLNYLIDSPGARVARGTARDIDARAYAFGRGPDGALAFHFGGGASLDDGAMRIPGLLLPATRMRGRVALYDGGITARDLTAKLGPLDVRLGGGLFGWSAPAFRLGLAVPRASLAEARRLFRFSQRLPLRGEARLTTLLEGAVGMPLVATCFTVPALAYGALPIEHASGRAIYYAGAVSLLGIRARYGGLDVAAEGAIDVGGRRTHTQLAVEVSGPARRIPYLAQAASGGTVGAAALLAGDGLRLDLRGAVAGRGPGLRLAAAFHLDPLGDGTLGPFLLNRDDGSSVAGAYYSARSRSESGFWLGASGLPLGLVPQAPHLPGLTYAPPDFSGRLDGSLAGEGPPSRFRIAGRVRGRGLRAGNVAVDDMTAGFAGTFASLRLGDVKARGPWGIFSGRGAYAGRRLALDGDYRGTFGELARLSGDLGASGPVRGPVALLIEPGRTIVQARGEATGGTRVRGVPVEEMSGTLAVTGRRLHVFAAMGSVAGGTLAAAGTLQGPAGLGVSLAGVAGAKLRAVVPLTAGTLAAIGRLTATDAGSASARFAGGLVLAGGQADGWPLDLSGNLAFARARLSVGRTDALLGPAVGSVTGSVAGVGGRAATYDLALHIVAARLGPLARAFPLGRPDVAGTLQGDLRLRGTVARPGIDGALAIPEGSLNGLSFRDATARVRLSRAGISARRGRVVVGSTAVRFGGFLRDGEAAARVEAPRADLADFNDFFDAGDTLGGTGRISARFVKRPGSVRTRADIAIAGLHYRRFDLGDARAVWRSSGPRVRGSLRFGGSSGTLETAGTLVLSPRTALAEMIPRSDFTGTARLRGLDLGVWLPALGFVVPLGGRVDADATVAGPLRNPNVRTDATLVGGTIGSFPVDRFVVSANTTRARTTVTSAELDLPSVAIVGSGSFGLRDRDPVSLALHATSPNISSLAARVVGRALPLSGTAQVNVAVDGTRAHPRVAGDFDLENGALRGVSIPRALGDFSLRGRDVLLSGIQVRFASGTLAFSGSVPLELAPLGLGPARAPIALQVEAKGLDMADFTPLLPAGSTLRGTLDGNVAIAGTAGAPHLAGGLRLLAGVVQSPLEIAPLTNVTAQLTLAGNDARLQSFHGEAGGGTLDATGSAHFSDLVRPGRDTTYLLEARANRLRLDLPAYGSGQFDGTLKLSHAPGSRPPALGGTLALSEATIPFSALLLAGGGTGAGPAGAGAGAAPAAAWPDLALDLAIGVGRNVRIRSANVDIGATGDLDVGGRSRAPELSGAFTSTGGTLSYFNTVFRLTDGVVTFEPDLGLIPTLEAHATTHLANPDPNVVRNVARTADITLALTGPINGLSIALSSDPPYDRQQILGLLLNAPALGASNLFGDTAQTPTLFGSNATNALPAGVAGTRTASGELSVAQEAFGIANAQFTRTLLAPIETSFASAVGLTSFNVNVDYTGSVGVTARKVLGKKLNALYGTTFGYPYRQTFGFEFKPSDATAAQVTVFQTLGATGLDSLTPTNPIYASSSRLQAAQNGAGTAGFSLSLQRLYP